MALSKDFISTQPSLRERVFGFQKLIDCELRVLRLKKAGTRVCLRMTVSDNHRGDPELEKALKDAYEFFGWRVGFAYSPSGAEIILS